MIMRVLKKLLLPGVTDKQVRQINDESSAMLQDADLLSKRHNSLLKKNGVTLRIYIATGGDHRGH